MIHIVGLLLVKNKIGLWSLISIFLFEKQKYLKKYESIIIAVGGPSGLLPMFRQNKPLLSYVKCSLYGLDVVDSRIKIRIKKRLHQVQNNTIIRTVNI